MPRYIKMQSLLPRVEDPILNRALEIIDEELDKIARMEIIGLDWTADQGASNIHDGNIVSSSITQHEGDIDHDALTNTHYLTVVDVRTYGMVPDDNTGSVPADNVAAWDALTAALSGGESVYLPTGTWYISGGTLDVDAESITILGDGPGSKIQQMTASTGIFNIDKSDMTLEKLNLVGSGQGSTGGTAIDISGADSSNYLRNIKVIDVDISLCERGITCNWIEQFEFRGGSIIDMQRSAVLLLSCQDGSIHDYYIEDVQGNNNADYGIAITRTAGAEATYPTSKRIDVYGNLVKDVTYWEGYDTHGGEDINFYNNKAYGCHRGFMLGDDNDTANTIHVPIDCDVIGNETDSESDAGDKAYGIYFGGTTYSGTDYIATGKVVGNTVRRHGYQASGGEHVGGIHLTYTEGVPVEANTLIECVSSAIVMYGNNHGFTTTGNTVVDLWSKSTGANEVRGVSVSYGGNTGYIGENSFSKTAGFSAPANGTSIYLDSANGRGVYVGDAAGNDILVGVNYSEATTYLLDPGNKVGTAFFKNLEVGGTFTCNVLTADCTETAWDSTTGLATFQDDTDRQIVVGGLGLFRRDTDGNADLRINYLGFEGGDTQFRDFDIYDGKAVLIARFDGSAGVLELINDFYMANNKNVQFKDSGGTYRNVFGLSSTDILEIGHDAAVLGIEMAHMKTGTDQADAGAAAGELYADENDDYTVKLGV